MRNGLCNHLCAICIQSVFKWYAGDFKIMRVLKIGGNELDNDDFLQKLAAAVATIRASEPVVIVHGGGRAIASLHTELRLPVRKVDGLRVTSSQSLAIAEMVLSGMANKLLVRALLRAGADALGISGDDEARR